jgi:hypothetical protein
MHQRLLVLVLPALAGCSLAPMDGTGRVCREASECPIGMACVAPTPGETGECRFGAAAGPPAGGNVPTYCAEVKPLLDQYCATCHRSPPGGGAPSSFRLDTYAAVDGIRGAQAKADRIAARLQDRDRPMPPPAALQPPAAARATLAAWANAGAPECGPVPGNGGTPPPRQVPETVSFSQHVMAVLGDFCVRCHGPANADGEPEGDLDLSQAPSRVHAQLLGRSDCESHVQRVVAGQPNESLLWMVLAGHASACGDDAPPMPLGTPGLKTVSPTDFLILERWIQQGAKLN